MGCAQSNPKNYKIQEMANKVVDTVWERYDKDKNGVLDKYETKNYIHECVRVL